MHYIFYSINGVGKIRQIDAKNKSGPPSYTTFKNKLKMKWIKDLNVRPETIKILEENVGSKILDNAPSNILSGISSQARETKEKINKWVYIKVKSVCTAKVFASTK